MIIRLLWLDATSTDEWTPAHEITGECHTIETVGLLVVENDECITLALNHDPEADSYSCFISIPKAWILNRKEFP